MWARRAPAEAEKGAPQRAAGFLPAGFHAGFAQSFEFKMDAESPAGGCVSGFCALNHT